MNTHTINSIITQELLNKIKPSPCYRGDINGIKFIECQLNQPIHEYYANSYTREIQAVRFSVGESDIGRTIKEVMIQHGHESLALEPDGYTIIA